MARRLVLLRHGRIAANRDGHWHGSTDSELLPEGRRQAARAARHLVQREPHFSAVYVSPLQRCQDTAQAFVDRWNRRVAAADRRRQWLARASEVTRGLVAPPANEPPVSPLSVQTVHDLREYCIGDWEGMAFAELARQHRFIERSCEDLHYAAPNGESIASVSERMTETLRSLDAAHGPEEDVLVVAHGAATAIGLATLLNRAPEKWRDYHLDNCSLSELSIGTLPELHQFNSSAHLGR
jgi:broad specificity phosphatase PhoE